MVSERDLHETVAQLLDRVLSPDAQWCCYPAGLIKLTPPQMARLTRAGLKTGWPDLLLLYGGALYGIELKAGKGRLSRDQIRRTARGAPRLVIGQETRFAALQAAGMHIAVCRAPEEVLTQLEAWGVPLRGSIAA